MRIVALLFGLLGAAGSGFLGAKWLSDANNLKTEIDTMRKVAAAVQDPKLDAKLKELDRVINTAYALIGAAGLGAVACALVLGRKGLIAAPLFFLALAIPIAILQDGKVAVFTFGLGFAGLFALLVRSAPPYVKPRKRDYIDEDDDLVG